MFLPYLNFLSLFLLLTPFKEVTLLDGVKSSSSCDIRDDEDDV